MKFFSKIPLKTILVVPFLLQIVMAVGFVGYLSYKNGQQAVEDLARQLMEEVGERISDRLDNYLHTPQQVVAANYLAWQDGTLDITNLEEVRQHLWQEIKLNPSITGIYFLNQGNESVGYGRILSQDMREVARKVSGEDLPIGTIYYSEAKKPILGQRKFYTTDTRGKPQKLVYPVKMNFRTLPWYVQARASRKQAWTPLIVYQAAPALGIFAVAPVYDRVGQLQAVFASDVNLSDIGAFLKKLDFSRSGQAFIIDRNGNLAAISTLEKPYFEPANSRPVPLSIFRSRDLRTREIAREIEKLFGNFKNLSNPQQLSVISQGEKLFVRVVPYQDEYGLDWLIVVAIPESDFMARINENNRLTILWCIVTLLVATEIGLLTARSIAKPILRLNAAAKKLTKVQLKRDIPLEGAKEVGELTDSFNRMAKVLINYNRTLEAQVKERTEALQHSEAQINAFFSSAPVGMGIVDRQLRFVKVNEFLAKIDGLTVEEEIGKTVWEVLPELANQIEPLYQQVLATGQPILNREISCEVPFKSGQCPYWIVSYFPIFDGNNFINWVGSVVVDITDRKHLEIALQEKNDELDQFFSAALDLLCIADTDGYFRRLNAEWQNTLGYSLRDLEGCRFLDLVHPEDLEITLDAVAKLSEQRLIFNFTNRYRHQDGSYRWIEWRSVPIGKLIYAAARDITNRKLAEIALQESEHKFSTIFHTSPDPLWIGTLSEGRCLNVNNSFVKLLEYSYEEIIGKTCVELKLWDKIEDLHYFRQALTNEGKLENFEVVIHTRSGEARTVLMSAIVSKLDNQDCVIGLLKDITDRKQLQLALQTSESRLRSVLNNAPAFISGVRLTQKDSWEYEYFSPGIEAICGYTGEEIAADPSLLMSLVLPEDIETIIKPILDELFTPNFAITIEYRLRHKNGSIRWVANSLSTYWDETTQFCYGTGIIIDISDRKRAEETLRQSESALAEAQKIAHLGSWSFDVITQKITWSEEMFHIFGRDPAQGEPGYDELIQQTYPDDLELLERNIELALTQRKNYEHEIRIVLPDGAIRYTFGKAEVLTNEAGQVVKLFGIVQDISDRKKVEAELSQAKEAAEAANHAKSAFLANMSHELRTPLNAILGFAQLISQNPTLPVEHRDNIAIINHSGQHLLTLINDVLDMAKIEAGQISLNEQNFNLHRFLDDIERMFSLKAKEKGLQLIFQRDYAVPEYVRTDEIKLRQVLINLISNGIKFTEAGNVFVKVSLNAQKSQFLILHWEVKDTGSGIFEDELERIFQPFLQTRTGKQSQEGTGLGLSISRKFVQMMGGEIRVKSQVGIGSIFQFDIQVSVVEPLNPETTNQPTRRSLALAPSQPIGVSYLHQTLTKKHNPSDLAKNILNHPNLAALPADLVERLEQATIRANWEQIHQTIDEIYVVNCQLAETLKQLVANFDYGNILAAIEVYKNLNKENYKN